MSSYRISYELWLTSNMSHRLQNSKYFYDDKPEISLGVGEAYGNQAQSWEQCIDIDYNNY